MARRQDVFVKRRGRKTPAALPALMVLVIAALVALSGAYAWQKLSGDDAKLLVKEQMDQPRGADVSALSDTPEGAAIDDGGESGSGSSESSASSVNSSSSSSSSGSSSASSASSASSEPQREPTGSDDIVGSAVGKSERAQSTYFDDAMFVGDSITAGILSYQIMQSTTVIAHTGINPDSIRSQKVYRDTDGELISILDAMAKYPNMNKIYIMLGANSAAWMDKDLFIKYYAEFLQSAMKQHPDATFYVQSILPINSEKFKVGPYWKQDLTNAKIQGFNKAIADMAQENGAYYLDVADAFRDDSFELPADATTDGMHFGTSYYQKWFDYLKTHTVQA